MPGLQAECACLGGAVGVQICQSDRTFGACACPTGDSSAGTGGGAGAVQTADTDASGGSGGGSSSGGAGNASTGGDSSSGGGGGANSSSGGTTSGAGGTNTVNTSTSTTGADVPESQLGLGEPCGFDEDCAGDLICVAADSNALLVGGPANGFCTSPCNAVTPCALDAACITFDPDAYCMPLCSNDDRVQDCGQRPDAVCDVVGVELSCTDDSDCPSPTYCLGGQCLLPVCLPKCRVDSDCPEGRFCHPNYGECVDEAPEGGGLNELCDPEGGAEECQGFCAGEEEGTARCLETCAFGVYPACGSESEDNGTAACLDAYLGGDVGDLAVCVGLCDCNSDCPDEALICVSFESLEQFAEPEIQGRLGFCVVSPEDPGDLEGIEILTCEE